MKKNENIHVAIIGMGRFGKLIKSTVAKSSSNFIIHGFNKGSDLNGIGHCDIIIPAVPISKFENVINEISPKLKPDSLVISVCSVMTHPTNILKKLPKKIQAISTHPMFGPDSTKKGLKNHKIAIHNISASSKTFNQLIRWSKKIGLKVIEITPDKHDKLLAQTQLKDMSLMIPNNYSTT